MRNRIVDHIPVRCRDLVPHPLNFRRHPTAQRQALVDSLTEIGLARSLLGYRLPDGKVQLIDGHLRAELDPEMEVTVEIVDVSEEEARHLLLTLDPLAALAELNADAHARLREVTTTRSEALAQLWDRHAQTNEELAERQQKEERAPAEQFLVLIECRDEDQQTALLERFQEEGLSCRALLS